MQADSQDPTGLNQDALKMFNRLGLQPSREAYLDLIYPDRNLKTNPLTGEEEAMLPPFLQREG